MHNDPLLEEFRKKLAKSMGVTQHRDNPMMFTTRFDTPLKQFTFVVIDIDDGVDTGHEECQICQCEFPESYLQEVPLKAPGKHGIEYKFKMCGDCRSPK